MPIGTARLRAERVQRSQLSRGVEAEDGAAVHRTTAAARRRTVKHTVRSLHQRREGPVSVGTSCGHAEVVHGGELTGGGNAENGSAALQRSSEICRPVEGTIRRLNKGSGGMRSVGTERVGAKTVQGGELALRRQLKNGSVPICTAVIRGPVKASIFALY